MVPYELTVTVAPGVFAFGKKDAVPLPEVIVHVPVPTLAVAFRSKSRSHSLPPLPAFATGCS